MELGAGLSFVMMVGAAEAQAAGYEELEPYHLFNGLLKLSELDDAALRSLTRDPAVAEALRAEQEAVAHLLTEIGLPPPERTRKVRHDLRRRLGRGGGGAVAEGQVLHRSPQARTLCEQATGIAAEDGKAQCDASDLLRAILAHPPESLSTALAPAEGVHLRVLETPELDRRATPIRPADEAGDPRRSDPVCRVLGDWWDTADRPALALLQAGREPTEAVLARFAAALACNHGREHDRVFLIKLPADLGAADADALLAECAQLPTRLFCLVPALPATSASAPAWAESLAKAVATRGSNLAVALPAAAYEREAAAETAWATPLRPLYVHDLEVLAKL